jgi:hypothetical protein
MCTLWYYQTKEKSIALEEDLVDNLDLEIFPQCHLMLIRVHLCLFLKKSTAYKIIS